MTKFLDFKHFGGAADCTFAKDLRHSGCVLGAKIGSV